MGVIKYELHHERKRKNTPQVNDQEDDYLHEDHDDQDHCGQEDDSSESAGEATLYNPKKPQKRFSVTHSPADEDDEEIELDMSQRPGRRASFNCAPGPVKSTVGKKIGLSADIRRDLHMRLKIHAVRQGTSIVKVIEKWIETYCPE